MEQWNNSYFEIQNGNQNIFIPFDKVIEVGTNTFETNHSFVESPKGLRNLDYKTYKHQYESYFKWLNNKDKFLIPANNVERFGFND